MCAGACTSVSFKLSVNSSNHSGRSRKRSFESRLPSLFLFCFWVLACDPLQFPEACPSFRSWAGPVGDKSCNVNVEDELLPELDDSPETTRGTKVSVMQKTVFTSLVNRGFLTADPLVGISVEQEAFLRVIALSRRDQDRERILVLPRLFTLLQ